MQGVFAHVWKDLMGVDFFGTDWRQKATATGASFIVTHQTVNYSPCKAAEQIVAQAAAKRLLFSSVVGVSTCERPPGSATQQKF